MYEIFVYDNKSSYCFYSDKIDATQHLQIEAGSHIFVPDLNAAYLVLGPGKWVLLNKSSDNPSEEPDEDLSVSILGQGVLGNLVLGSED